MPIAPLTDNANTLQLFKWLITFQNRCNESYKEGRIPRAVITRPMWKIRLCIYAFLLEPVNTLTYMITFLPSCFLCWTRKSNTVPVCSTNQSLTLYWIRRVCGAWPRYDLNPPVPSCFVNDIQSIVICNCRRDDMLERFQETFWTSAFLQYWRKVTPDQNYTEKTLGEDMVFTAVESR